MASKRPASASSGAAADTSVEGLLLQLANAHPDGLTNAILAKEMAHVSADKRVVGLNSMLQSGKLTLFQASGELVYKVANKDVKTKGLTAEEMLVYQVIKASANQGVWTRDMKIRTNLAQPQITKILKALEGRNLIKSIKSVNNPSRKLYMCYELEPSRELTGGAWYTANQFDSEFINVLCEACYKYIQNKDDQKAGDEATLSEIQRFVSSKGFAKVELREEDIQMILDTLVYDGRLEQLMGEDEDSYRLTTGSIPDDTAFTSIPCGKCPVFGECKEGGPISPQTCVYYQEWLNF